MYAMLFLGSKKLTPFSIWESVFDGSLLLYKSMQLFLPRWWLLIMFFTWKKLTIIEGFRDVLVLRLWCDLLKERRRCKDSSKKLSSFGLSLSYEVLLFSFFSRSFLVFYIFYLRNFRFTAKFVKVWKGYFVSCYYLDRLKERFWVYRLKCRLWCDFLSYILDWFLDGLHLLLTLFLSIK